MSALLSMAMAILASAQVFPFLPAPSGPPEIDHFHCYFVQSPMQPVSALLQDQFDAALNQSSEVITDLRAVELCPPVQKTLTSGKVTPINHPTDHLLMYLINPQPITPRIVLVENQFGYQILRTRNAVMLAVPSGKVLPTPAGEVPPLPPIPTDLDHYKCYSASGDIATHVVGLSDQFMSTIVDVIEPILFCNPVQKTIPSATPTVPGTVTPITDPRAHLTCYVVTPRPFQGLAYYNNQFVNSTPVAGATPPPPSLVVLQSEILCAPSYKLAWEYAPPPPATLTPGSAAGE
ncbi:MAG: hypothetical protein ACLQBJ_01600 [Bryobacteraceae bacterium]